MLKRLSIRYKIGFIALIGFIGFFVFQAASYRLSINIRDQLEVILTEDFPVLKFSNDAQVNFSELDKLYQASLAEADMDTLIEADAKATQMRLEFEMVAERFNANDPTFRELNRVFNDYVDKTSAHTAAVLTNSLNYEDTLAGYSEVGLLRERYREIQNTLLEERYRDFELELADIEEDENYLVRFGLILGVILTLILGAFSIIIIRRLISAFSNAVDVAEQIASGNLEQDIETVSQDETGQLMESLSAMRDALKAQYEQNHQREKLQTFLAGLNEAMRGDKHIDDLGADILEYIATSLHAQLGAFYLSELNILTMAASYGYPFNETDHPSFRLGESVVGQAALEKQAQIITDIPDNYVEVGTGLGKAKPRSLLLFPILFENKLRALIEIAAFRTFSEEDLLVIQRCNDAIAIAINSAQSRNKVASMLQQTQQQAQELKNQRQELAVINRQLEERTTDLDEQKNQIMEKNAELENSRKELLEKSRALELSGKYKSQFLSTMSHELRTPLNSILILSEALKENATGHLNSKEVEHANVINTAGADLLALINDILDLSKVEEGKMEVVIDEISVQDLVFNLTHQFEYMAQEKGLDYHVSVGDSVPERFYSDRHRLKQIIKNFISNALKFTHEGGVYVDIRRPQVADIPADCDLQADQAVMIQVRDTGVGIEKSKQDVVFEAFRQADGTTSRKYGGTGLGLTISRELARLLGGAITLQSAGVGHGSVFSLLLPQGSADDLGDNPGSPFTNVANSVPMIEVHLTDEIAVLGSSDPLQIFIEQATQQHLPLRLFNSEQEAYTYLQDSQPRVLLVSADYCHLQGEPWFQAQTEAFPVYMDIAPADAQLDTLQRFPVEEDAIQALVDDCIYGRSASLAKVLVVEDNVVFHEVIKAVFARNHLAVDIVENGKRAIEAVSCHLYDYLVVDLNLPDVEGMELIRAIRTVPLYQQRTVVLFTAEDLLQEQYTQYSQLVNRVVMKSPTAVNEICEDVKAVLKRKLEQPWGAQPVPQAIDYQSGMLNERRVLLVDDDARNLYSISAALEAEGIDVISAQSGKGALALLAAEGPDMVLLDIMMPEMDGYQVLSEIRSQSAFKQLPVIALTAKAMVGDKEKCLAAGASAYHSKPVDVHALLSTMATLLQSGK